MRPIFSTGENWRSGLDKLEGYNPTGSVKDRGCIYILKSAVEHGLIRRGKTLLDASSGNMACALAYFSAKSSRAIRCR